MCWWSNLCLAAIHQLIIRCITSALRNKYKRRTFSFNKISSLLKPNIYFNRGNRTAAKHSKQIIQKCTFLNGSFASGTDGFVVFHHEILIKPALQQLSRNFFQVARKSAADKFLSWNKYWSNRLWCPFFWQSCGSYLIVFEIKFNNLSGSKTEKRPIWICWIHNNIVRCFLDPSFRTKCWETWIMCDIFPLYARFWYLLCKEENSFGGTNQHATNNSWLIRREITIKKLTRLCYSSGLWVSTNFWRQNSQKTNWFFSQSALFDASSKTVYGKVRNLQTSLKITQKQRQKTQTWLSMHQL